MSKSPLTVKATRRDKPRDGTATSASRDETPGTGLNISLLRLEPYEEHVLDLLMQGCAVDEIDRKTGLGYPLTLATGYHVRSRVREEFPDLQIAFPQLDGIINEPEVIEGAINQRPVPEEKSEHYLKDKTINLSDVRPEFVDLIFGISKRIIDVARNSDRSFTKALFDIAGDVEARISQHAMRATADLPSMNIPDGEWNRLADKWANDIARVQVGLPLDEPSSAPGRPSRGLISSRPTGGPWVPPSDSASVAVPMSFEEARRHVPGLLRWSAARRAGQGILEHLRDPKTGYGFWTRDEPGLPRAALLAIDGRAHRELADFLAIEGNALPGDIKVPRYREAIAKERATLDADDVRWARRTVRNFERAKARSKEEGAPPPSDFDPEEIKRARRILAWHDRTRSSESVV